MTQSRIVRLFLAYAKIDTRSILPRENKENLKPSSKGQGILGNKIKNLLTAYLGVNTNQIQDLLDGSFLVKFPASPGISNSIPHVAFAAHLDTYYGFPGQACPIVHDYSGGDIILPHNGIVIPQSDLVGLKGKQIITADGTTLLGGDDKAGVVALILTIESLLSEKIEHGPLTFWFCVDEEVGLDVTIIPKEIIHSWDVLWTLDGERLGPINIGCFGSHVVELKFKGVDAHPGVQGDRLKPAHYAAATFIARLGKEYPTPMETSGLEAFYYAVNISGNPTNASVLCAPRSFYQEESDQMLKVLMVTARYCANQYGCNVEITHKPVCINTRPAIEKRMDLIQPGLDAHLAFGIESNLTDIRGGTDGAMINMICPDLPAPNMGTGGKNLHGPQEFLVIEELEQLPIIVLGMIRRYARFSQPE